MNHIYLKDDLLVRTALANQDLLEAVIPGSHDRERIRKADLRMTAAALHCGLYFRVSKPLAFISGAGIAGLSAAFQLLARGFKVVVAEKRKEFSRVNVINLNVETQIFLKKFNLLEKFEKFVAARIKEHRYILIDKSKVIKRLALSDVSQLRFNESLSLTPENFNQLFEQDGIYSVSIGVLQTFLAENALETGVNIFGDTTPRIVSRTKAGGVSKVQITAYQTLQPDLFFIAEGAHSTTARQLGIRTKEIQNACTGEKWIFGNMTYTGKENFVVSMIDASGEILRIANVIFNALGKVINVAVTSDQEVSEDGIRKLILQTARQVFDQRVFPIEEMSNELLSTVLKSVRVTNRICFPFSMGNIFCIGDSAGSSSPLAGLGGSLGIFVFLIVKQVIDDYEKQSGEIHENFHQFSEAYISRWFQKSENIKKFCISVFNKSPNDYEEKLNEN